MREEYKHDAIFKIDYAVWAREKGLITVDEAIEFILNA